MIYLQPIKDIILGIVYRFRGGGFFSTGHDWIVRIVWGLSLTLAYLFDNVRAEFWPYVAAITPLAYLSMLVPHAVYQNMGRWPSPQKGWPGFFLPAFTQTQWTALPGAARTLNDFIGMGAVAFFRAAIVFGPLLGLQYALGHAIALAGVLTASAALVIGQPLAYLLGWYVPFTIGASLTKFSTEWCELFNGVVWGIALWMLS